MRRIPLIGLLFLGVSCSDSEDPNVSEAPHTSEREVPPLDSAPYVIDKEVGLAIEVLVEGDGPLVRAGDLITVHYRGTVLASTPTETEEAEAEEDPESVDGESTGEADSEPTGSEVDLDVEGEVDTEDVETEDVAASEVSTSDVETLNEAEPQEDFVFGDTFKHGVPLRISLQRGSAIEGWRRGLIGMRVGSRVVLLVSSELAYGEAGMPSARIPENADLRYEIELLETCVSNRPR
ncbi:MAG: FKBP-type peptidyl-prolyl cis-trans isomerase [Planctomycetota bacterium]|jgi:FKBP-type peptidyl-prolyl cis-trans isomerase